MGNGWKRRQLFGGKKKHDMHALYTASFILINRKIILHSKSAGMRCFFLQNYQIGIHTSLLISKSRCNCIYWISESHRDCGGTSKSTDQGFIQYLINYHINTIIIFEFMYSKSCVYWVMMVLGCSALIISSFCGKFGSSDIWLICHPPYPLFSWECMRLSIFQGECFLFSHWWLPRCTTSLNDLKNK